MAVLLLTERRISAFGRSPAHLPAEREQQLSFGDRLIALPMAALWTLDTSG